MAGNTINATTASEDLQKDKEANQVRFEEDLEFVQSLANPHFVQELTLNGTLRSETMINTWIPQYFHHPDYARSSLPTLEILDLLTARAVPNDDETRACPTSGRNIHPELDLTQRSLE
ncbi:uncharacterized protein PGTG_12224 [Puccinia graminis f. sp. tritici CRL 75-36-700-3]|uniref:Mediator of RNA polymerase II transcription subunit 31 n=1 Tax=Puccinia graminis f. sp. tritici (strain CRL 75-36-700-3 / race SCCL) TaxID=418459 RepID=E3KPN3_PUCGT|nr:uncharacterized protein PGTG_12224 [Puccinia graminis f. sp. tritici CRL 75-36-700-3]EFP86268.1 hypothetical protein PGTG_12224 [Puccinia graminis f. sp. tritici CRL 75-36-700-3]